MGKKSSAASTVLTFLLLLSCTLLASLLSSRPVALADDTSLGATGGTVYPVKSADVRLDAETVQATCFGEFVEYRVDFRFVNDGAARTIRLGFPFNYADYLENDTTPPVGFQAWQDGRPLQVRVVPASYNEPSLNRGYFAHSARFPHGPTTITVSYLAEASVSANGRRTGVEPGDPGFGYASWYEYWLHTGYTWKGPIGEAVIRYRLAEGFAGSDVELTAAEAFEGLPVTSPEGWTKPLPQTYQWRLVDFEPAPTRDSDWWQPMSPYDVILGFTRPAREQAARVTWNWSSAASFGDPEEGIYTSISGGGLSNCWAEGVPGTGEGEWVEAIFKTRRHLRELRILPGNNMYLAAFTKYARPKVLKAVFSDGSSTLLRFRDAPALQRFPVDVTTQSVRFVVESVYPGTDYPGTCISEVEFGAEEAPGYASFADLLADDRATGRLPSWAGPPAPAPKQPSREPEWREVADAEAVACGDLIGVDQWEPFPADQAPFKEPAEPSDVEEKASSALLPEEDLVGEPREVNALSSLTYEVHYDSGIDLLVNTDLRHVSTTSVLAELSEEAGGAVPYEDGRRLPYDVQSIGRCVVGVARPGVLEGDYIGPDESGIVPGQVFWRDGDMSYHLFARSQDVTIEELVEVATSLIYPSLHDSSLDESEDVTITLGRSAKGWLVTLVALAAVAVVIGVVVRRREASAQ